MNVRIHGRNTEIADDVRELARDKVEHALAFGLMQWTHARAVAFFWPKLSGRQVALVTFGTAALAGGLLELWQFALPHRMADWADFAADAVGAAIGALLWLRFRAGR